METYFPNSTPSREPPSLLGRIARQTGNLLEAWLESHMQPSKRRRHKLSLQIAQVPWAAVWK